MYANALVNSFGTAATTSAFVDPKFTIDPSFGNAADYTINHSLGLLTPVSVPEPSTLALMATALAAGLLVYRKRLITLS